MGSLQKITNNSLQRIRIKTKFYEAVFNLVNKCEDILEKIGFKEEASFTLNEK